MGCFGKAATALRHELGLDIGLLWLHMKYVRGTFLEFFFMHVLLRVRFARNLHF